MHSPSSWFELQTNDVADSCRWVAKLTVKEMCEDQWKWASTNPDGYDVKI